MSTILGLIPARGGSKSIPGKNIVPLAGRAMLAYTCEAALRSRELTRTIISTDDEGIAQIGRACGLEVPFVRPAELADDDTPSLRVAQHALQWLIDHEAWRPDIMVLLQPTSPLRQAHHIDAALKLMIQAGADTVVSVVEVPHRFSPYAVMRLQDGSLHPFWDEPVAFDRFRRQSVPVLYARNGPAILATRVNVIANSDTFYGPHTIPYVMTVEDSVDIDTPFDLRLAEWLLVQRQK